MKAVSGKDLCKAIERKGWRLVRTRGSHHTYKSPDGSNAVSVPVHGNRTLPTGTQQGIMKTVALTGAEL